MERASAIHISGGRGGAAGERPMLQSVLMQRSLHASVQCFAAMAFASDGSNCNPPVTAAAVAIRPSPSRCDGAPSRRWWGCNEASQAVIGCYDGAFDGGCRCCDGAPPSRRGRCSEASPEALGCCHGASARVVGATAELQQAVGRCSATPSAAPSGCCGGARPTGAGCSETSSVASGAAMEHRRVFRASSVLRQSINAS